MFGQNINMCARVDPLPWHFHCRMVFYPFFTSVWSGFSLVFQIPCLWGWVWKNPQFFYPEVVRLLGVPNSHRSSPGMTGGFGMSRVWASWRSRRLYKQYKQLLFLGWNPSLVWIPAEPKGVFLIFSLVYIWFWGSVQHPSRLIFSCLGFLFAPGISKKSSSVGDDPQLDLSNWWWCLRSLLLGRVMTQVRTQLQTMCKFQQDIEIVCLGTRWAGKKTQVFVM